MNKNNNIKAPRSVFFVTVGLALFFGLISGGALSATDKANGKKVYDHWCTPCHAAGRGHPGTQSLSIKYRGSEIPAVLEEREDLTAEFVKTMVRQGVLSMAPFRKTEITDAELEDIAAYLTKN